MSVVSQTAMQTAHLLFKDLESLRFITSPQGEAQSVILSIEDFKRLLETLSIEAKTDLIDSIDRARQQLRKGQPLMTYEEVFGANL